ncbi:glycosyltransferase family A protein [Sulfurovum sp. zt1-1]|uniref:Glycosyltransferase family A protein n=1 Tax=Sulfurovum zhangzhouensis TaxID=3019067 RepID=A0ABT7QZX8_9BACT|nr:glycosyltransferase family A protein [Sulfurovum zhangzhouensis]MDM5272400.1 glycosyltransferase family A protein [Sulfurovum zhangzhouensis]
MKLNILISTIDNRILNLKNILQTYDANITYIISHQVTQDLNHELETYIDVLSHRDDVVYGRLPNKGVAKNRNNTLRYLQPSTVSLIVDDDVILCENAFYNVLQAFLENPSADFISFKILDLEDKDFKSYPKVKQWHSLRTLTGIGTTEVAFKSDFVLSNQIRFDERFGPGSDIYPSGEDFIFAMDLYKRKAKMLYIPIPIVKHPHDSTGNDWNSNIVFAKGAVFARVFGYLSVIVDVYFSLKHRKEYKEQFTFYRYLKRMLSGSYDYLSRKCDA